MGTRRNQVAPAERRRSAVLAQQRHDRTPSAYAEARALEAAGEVEAAVEAFGAIAASEDPAAEDALYAVARLRLTGEGGRAALEAYRAAHPDGRYARVVDGHMLDLHAAAGDCGAVIREADRFLAAHGDDVRAPRFRAARASCAPRR